MKWIFLPLFLLAFQFLTAQNDLYVNNPQEGWHFEQGFIDEAELHIKPKGIYMEYGLYLTMSIPEDYFDPSSQLEIVMNFTLPEEAHIIDSWLWVEEDIVRADIIDRWTANQIYEDIVDRRQDPSILFKNGQGQYQLRIYPLFSDGNRKVKITYLMPTRWEDGKVQVDLPNELLRTSVIPPDLRVRTFLPAGWAAPKLLSDRTESFVTASDPVFGTFQETVVNQEIVWEENLVFEVESPMEDGIYLSTFTEDEENFYQLVYQPDFTDDLYNPRHVLVLMDYQINNSDIDKTEMIEMVKNQLHSELNANDFFNVIANDVPIYTANNNWISATDTNIDETLNNAAEQLVQYSSLPNLLFEGISYAQQNDGSVLLIANSGNLWELETANSLLDDLNVLLDEKEVPIHVADYHNRNLRFSHFGNQQFAGNQYLYSRLTGRTGGEFTHLYYQHNGQNVYTNQLRSVLQQMQNINANFDLHTDVTNGFCYARYNFNNGNVINRPFMQMGKFSGEFPFQIELAGTFDGQLFNEETSVNTALDADPTLIQSWTGQWIREQELLNQNTNSSINEVIDVSLDERVLSYFTAFLALEPNQGGEICQSCDNPDINTGGGDGGECCILAVDDISLKGISELKAAPNPFTQQTTVQLKLGNDWKDSRAQIRIFNQLGQLVYSFTEQELKAGEEYEFTWNATDLNGQPLPKGIYFFQIQTEGGTQVVKLVFQ